MTTLPSRPLRIGDRAPIFASASRSDYCGEATLVTELEEKLVMASGEVFGLWAVKVEGETVVKWVFEGGRGMR